MRKIMLVNANFELEKYLMIEAAGDAIELQC